MVLRTHGVASNGGIGKGLSFHCERGEGAGECGSGGEGEAVEDGSARGQLERFSIAEVVLG